jgi:hypothetical protein
MYSNRTYYDELRENREKAIRKHEEQRRKDDLRQQEIKREEQRKKDDLRQQEIKKEEERKADDLRQQK